MSDKQEESPHVGPLSLAYLPRTGNLAGALTVYDDPSP